MNMAIPLCFRCAVHLCRGQNSSKAGRLNNISLGRLYGIWMPSWSLEGGLALIESDETTAVCSLLALL